MIDPSTRSNRHLPVIKYSKDKYCYDIEGREYLDFIGGNNTVILGHKRFRFKHSPMFSGMSVLEDEVSDMLSRYTNTKYFRYFKNGTDAVSCAIRLARHLLGKEDPSIGFIGYGGSNNEYAFTVNDNGIPIQNSFQITAEASCDILVYESRYKLRADNIKAKFKICDHLKSGILGLEEPTADIDLYGKSLSNGYPVSVMTGKDETMSQINEIYYSTTYGGDNTGLEAIKLTLEQFKPIKHRYLKILEYAKENLPEWKSINGDMIKKFLDKGILFNGNWQLMTGHNKKDIDQLKSAIDDLM